jgi:hypothetical protein
MLAKKDISFMYGNVAGGAQGSGLLYVNGFLVGQVSSVGGASFAVSGNLSAIIPVGDTYQVLLTGTAIVGNYWNELR